MTGGNGSAGVAIVGIACRFPGAADHRAFWQNLCEGVESISALSDEDLAVGGSPCRAVARSVLREGRLVAAGHRPVRCRLLRIFAARKRGSWIRSSGCFWRWRGRPSRTPDNRVGSAAQPIGVFTGLGGVVSSYLVDRLPFSADLPGYTGSLTHLGNDKDFPSTRISYKLNLTGPSINVQTACSTSLGRRASRLPGDPRRRMRHGAGGSRDRARAPARRLYERERRHPVARRTLPCLRCRRAGHDFRQRRRRGPAQGPCRRRRRRQSHLRGHPGIGDQQ